MRKTLLLIALVLVSIKSYSQIPNNGFENWTNIGNYENPNDWNNCNSSASNS